MLILCCKFGSPWYRTVIFHCKSGSSWYRYYKTNKCILQYLYHVVNLDLFETELWYFIVNLDLRDTDITELSNVYHSAYIMFLDLLETDLTNVYHGDHYVVNLYCLDTELWYLL